MSEPIVWEKLSKDSKEKTLMMAGTRQYTIDELESKDNDISRKLDSVEPYLKKYRK